MPSRALISIAEVDIVLASEFGPKGNRITDLYAASFPLFLRTYENPRSDL